MYSMLSSKEISILKYLNSLGGQVDYLGRNTTQEALALKFNIVSQDISYYISHLLELSLIKQYKSVSNSIVCYSITTRGENFLEFLKSDKQSKIIWSILVPIGVAIVTTLIINFLT